MLILVLLFRAVKGCKYVLHVASPFPGSGGKVQDVERDLMRPAVDGTLNVLRACAKAGSVKRVVVTSSVAAVFSDIKHRGEERKYSEEDWTDPEDPDCDKYCASKTKAERAAWDFVKQLPGKYSKALA
jgi:nucleoside-diphosphate-sugar epimerase